GMSVVLGVERRSTLAVWVSVGALALVQQSETVRLDVVRFYRSAGAVTAVDGFCRVRVSAVSPLPGGGRGGAAYRVSLTVHDSAGLKLTSQSWSQSVPAAMLGVASASLAEHFAFAARPGRYAVHVATTNSAERRVRRPTL